MVLLPYYTLKTSPPTPDRPIDRIAENVDIAWDETTVDDFLTELNWAEHARSEDTDW